MTLDGNHFQKRYLWNHEVMLQRWAETFWGFVRWSCQRGEEGRAEGELVCKPGEKGAVAVQA